MAKILTAHMHTCAQNEGFQVIPAACHEPRCYDKIEEFVGQDPQLKVDDQTTNQPPDNSLLSGYAVQPEAFCRPDADHEPKNQAPDFASTQQPCASLGHPQDMAVPSYDLPDFWSQRLSLRAKQVVQLLCPAPSTTPWTLYARMPILLDSARQTIWQHILAREDAHKVPPARLVGWTQFCGHRIRISADTLEPRWETELLVDISDRRLHTLQAHLFPHQQLRILDLGTGTGCVLLSLLARHPTAWGTGVDMHSGALVTAQTNSHALGCHARVTWVQSDWCAAFCPVSRRWSGTSMVASTRDQQHNHSGVQGYHLIVSNPPYIGIHDPVDEAVRQWDPGLALWAGESGLQAYTTIIQQTSHTPALWADPDTATLVLEIASNQAQAVQALLVHAGWPYMRCWQDDAGMDRVIMAWRG